MPALALKRAPAEAKGGLYTSSRPRPADLGRVLDHPRDASPGTWPGAAARAPDGRGQVGFGEDMDFIGLGELTAAYDRD